MIGAVLVLFFWLLLLCDNFAYRYIVVRKLFGVHLRCEAGSIQYGSRSGAWLLCDKRAHLRGCM